MINWLYAVGHATGTVFNMAKTRGPATRLVTLALLFCLVTRSCRVGDKKRDKYLSRIGRLLLATTATSNYLEQVLGNLGYAACLAPFGRPLLTFLAHHIDPKLPLSHVTISSLYS